MTTVVRYKSANDLIDHIYGTMNHKYNIMLVTGMIQLPDDIKTLHCSDHDGNSRHS